MSEPTRRPRAAHRRRIAPRTLAAVAVVTLTATGVTASVIYDRSASASSCVNHVRSDFNGDGHADLAASEPSRTIGGEVEAGAVRVLAGTSSGLSTTGNAYFDAGVLGLTANGFDNAGWSLAAGFFDSDCYSDLAVGVPGANHDNGEVLVLYGSSSGLSAARKQTFEASALNTGDTTADNFGYALAAGDFDHDGYDGLAVGAPGDANWAGAVGVLRGSSTGLTASGGAWISQNSANVPGAVEAGDQFGFSLAAADFTGDKRDDLAVGVPYEDVSSAADTGTVDVFLGSPSGITTVGSKARDQNSSGVVSSNASGDNWGYAIAAGDVTKDGKADLIVGAPGKTSGSARRAGAITVLRGASTGLTGSKSQHFDQNTNGVPGASETNDQFGTSLTVGDFNGNGYADVAIGVPSEAIGSAALAGSVTVMYGTSSGLTAGKSTGWTQNTSGIGGVAEAHDVFGMSVLALNVVSKTRADLVVGVPGESTSMFTASGLVALLKSSSSGIKSTGDQAITSTGLVNGGQSSHSQVGFGCALS